LLAVVLVILLGYIISARDISSSAPTWTPPKAAPTPTPAQVLATAPKSLQLVMAAVTAQPRVVITQSGGGGKYTFYIDVPADFTGVVSSGVLGAHSSFADANGIWSFKTSCLAKEKNGVITAGALSRQLHRFGVGGLPFLFPDTINDLPAVVYAYPRAGEIAWKLRSSSKTAPQGLLITNPKTHLPISAVVDLLSKGASEEFSLAAPSVLHLTFSYPATMKVATAPALCH
jgi:hypothetical protein